MARVGDGGRSNPWYGGITHSAPCWVCRWEAEGGNLDRNGKPCRRHVPKSSPFARAPDRLRSELLQLPRVPSPSRLLCNPRRATRMPGAGPCVPCDTTAHAATEPASHTATGACPQHSRPPHQVVVHGSTCCYCCCRLCCLPRRSCRRCRYQRHRQVSRALAATPFADVAAEAAATAAPAQAARAIAAGAKCCPP